MRPIFVAVAFALLLAAPLAIALEPMERPTLHVGDEWSYVVRFENPLPDGTREPHAFIGKRAVIAQETTDVAAQPVETLRIVEVAHDLEPGEDPLSLAGEPLDFGGGAQIEWVRVSDGLTVKSMRLRALRTGDLVADGPIREYPDGCDLVGYPLTLGKDAEGECRLLVKERDSSAETILRPLTRVIAVENVTVPAGTFETFVTDVGAQGVVGERQWYTPEACWRVKTNATANNIRMELLGFRCGDRTQGQLNAAEPPLDVDKLKDPRRGAPGFGPAMLVALAALALVRRRARDG